MINLKLNNKIVVLALVVCLLSTTLIACGSKKDENKGSNEKNKTQIEEKSKEEKVKSPENAKAEDSSQEEQSPVNNQGQPAQGGTLNDVQTTQPQSQPQPVQNVPMEKSPAQGGNQEGCLNDAIFN